MANGKRATLLLIGLLLSLGCSPGHENGAQGADAEPVSGYGDWAAALPRSVAPQAEIDSATAAARASDVPLRLDERGETAPAGPGADEATQPGVSNRPGRGATRTTSPSPSPGPGATAAQKKRSLDAALRAASSGTLLFRDPATGLLEPGPLVDAAVDRLRMRVDGRVLEGEVREKQKAKREYTQARSEGRRASLVEQQRPNVFTAFVANIEPGGEITVEIEYQQSVRLDQGRLSLRFPTVVAPRNDRLSGPGTHVNHVNKGGPGPFSQRISRVGFTRSGTPPISLAATDRSVAMVAAKGAPLLQPPLLANGIENPVSIHVDLAPGFALSAIDSPYHAIRIRGDVAVDDRFEIDLREDVVPSDRDFELSWTPEPGAEPQVALFTEQFDGRHYALLTLMPPDPQQRGAPLPREVILVLDTSGSMAGTSIEQAREALALALGRLTPSDRFNVIEFDNAARSIFPEAVEATPAHVEKALGWLGALQANGGTDIGSALSLALDGDAPAGTVRQVVFLTDGAVNDEAALVDQVRGELRQSRIFAVGIGSAPNSYLMRKLAEIGRGSFTHIGKTEEIGERMEGLFRKLETVALGALELELPSGARARSYPNPLPDLYASEPVSVALELDAPLDWVTVRGERAGERWIGTADRRDAEPRPGVHVLFARRKIDALMHMKLRDPRDLEARKRDVTRVALGHHLVSAFTSLVVVDRTPIRRDNESLRSGMVAANLPAGMDAASFGFAQGASGAALHQLIGAALLLSGAAIRRLRSSP
jgi:Ca-activated chloride channel family protein